MKYKFPTFFTGVTGVGKSIIIQSALLKLKKTEEYEDVPMSFSSQTSSFEVQSTIEANLEKKKKTLLAGHDNKTACIFIDDVNMPDMDSCGT